jgi:glycerol-1-phosphate dehydrogenase [NAD(P)+]
MHNFALPLFMQVKRNAVGHLQENLQQYLPQLVQGRFLVLTTAGLLQTLAPKVKILLAQLASYQVVTVSTSSFDFAVQVAKQLSMGGYQAVLGLGGGTALDTAKYAAYVAGVPYIAIPTTLSNDGVCSPVSVQFAEGGRKHSFTSKIPDGLLIDTDIILKAPRLLMEAGVGDILSNYTALFDWRLACREHNERPNDFAYLLSEQAVNSLLHSNVKTFESIEGVKMLAEALVLGGLSMSIAGNSRPCSGSDHLFCHALDELYDHGLPHGIVVAIGTIGACVFQGRPYQPLLAFLKAYGIDINPGHRGISREMFSKAWLYAPEVRKERYTILNKCELTEAKLNQLYDMMLREC